MKLFLLNWKYLMILFQKTTPCVKLFLWQKSVKIYFQNHVYKCFYFYEKKRTTLVKTDENFSFFIRKPRWDETEWHTSKVIPDELSNTFSCDYFISNQSSLYYAKISQVEAKRKPLTFKINVCHITQNVFTRNAPMLYLLKNAKE